MINLIAPAKINLYLHITGRRADQYHLLDSLFVFMDFGDEIVIEKSDRLELIIKGPFSENIKDNNIVYRAAQLLKEKFQVKQGAKIILTKNIPVGAGLGGGSSDAAATLGALNQLWEINTDEKTLASLGLSLGADVPSCLYQKPALISGIGDIIHPLKTHFEKVYVLLVKPVVSLSTPLVYQTYQKLNRSFSLPNKTPQNFICAHNDLEPVAIYLAPEIKILLDVLKKQDGCFLSRMSGSGSACFALFSDHALLKKAMQFFKKTYPNYWIQEATMF